ncbi:MAG: hypothetical protein ACYTHK_08910 [Planctomycetota bacterium]
MIRGILLILLAGCASVSREPTSATFRRAELFDVMVRWREGERRRDVEMAQSALYFENAGDREFHARELESLRGVYAGPIRTAIEFHLVGEPGGPGDYLFLEPAGRNYKASFVTIVALGGRPRVLYRRPALPARERANLEPDEVMRASARHRLAFWESLEGAQVDRELERVRRMLRCELEAEEYARRNELPLAPFEPDPRSLLEHLEPLEPADARDWIVSTLRRSLVAANRSD